MGRANCCTTGQYEGLFYIDNEDLHLYTPRGEVAWEELEPRLLRDISYEEMNDWDYSPIDTEQWFHDVMEEFKNEFVHRFPSFKPCDTWATRDSHAILENGLFYIAFEDNEWSTAVELLQKEDLYGNLRPLRKKLYQTYLNGIRDALFKQFDNIYIRTGPWTSGKLSREEAV